MKKGIAILLTIVLVNSLLMLSAVGSSNWTVSTFAGDGLFGHTDGVASSARFETLEDIAVDPAGNVYVSEGTSGRVRKIDTSGNVTTITAGITVPDGLAADGSGNIYFSDYSGHQIWKITNGVASVFVGTGVAGHVDDPQAQGIAQFNNPSNLVCDAAGNVYVIDKYYLRKITPSGAVTTVAGDGTDGVQSGQGTAAKIGRSEGIAIDAQGNLYISLQNAHRILKVDTLNYQVETYAGTGVAGSTDGDRLSQAQFNKPMGIAIDPSGNIYVADRLNFKVRMISPSGQVSTIAGTGVTGSTDGDGSHATFASGASIAYVGSNTLLVNDKLNYKIRKLVYTPPAPTVVRVTGVRLNETSLVINNTRSWYVLADVKPAHATDTGVKWVSSDENVAVVDAKGVITAAGYGKATISVVTVDGGYEASVEVSVPGLAKPETVVKQPGYLKGFADGTFRPNATVTRGELAVMMARLMKLSDGTVDGSLQVLKDKGLLLGDGKGNLLASQKVTKATWNLVAKRYLGDKSLFAYSFSANAGEELLTREEAVIVLNKLFDVKLIRNVGTLTFKDVPKEHRSFNQIESAAK